MTTGNLRERVEKAISKADAEYVEVRVEEAESSTIRYRGLELEEIGRSNSLGGSIRALAGGGWGFVCFNNLNEIEQKIQLAVKQAKFVAGEKVVLADAPSIVDIVPPILVNDPGTLTLSDKKAVLDDYAQIMMGVPQVQSCVIGYSDGRRRVTFMSSIGSYIEQERVDVSLRLGAMARDGSEVQQSGVSIGSLGDFGVVQGLHQQAKEVAEKAVALLRAQQAPGGETTVILDPILAGVFIHEAFGHLSEADHVYTDSRMQELMVMGRHFGDRNLNVVDGAAVGELRGSYKYDDEGIPSQRTYLIEEGRLVGRLHSRETAAKLGEVPTGNARAINYRFPPIVRMTNTFIEPGSAKPEDLFEGVKEGVYACNWYGGMTSMEMFTFSAGEAYMIRNGKIEEMVRPVMLSGNLFTTLLNLDGIADDIDMNQGGGCGKGGQSPLPVSNGSPHIRIRNCLVGGQQ